METSNLQSPRRMFPPRFSPSRPLSRTSLACLCALGFGASLWALFQWAELLVARAGGTPFCGSDGRWHCAAIWDSAFARRVQEILILPVAGWGLVWGLVAAALPLLALAREAPEPSVFPPPWSSAINARSSPNSPRPAKRSRCEADLSWAR
jgi:hypothetical protein